MTVFLFNFPSPSAFADGCQRKNNELQPFQRFKEQNGLNRLINGSFLTEIQRNKPAGL